MWPYLFLTAVTSGPCRAPAAAPRLDHIVLAVEDLQQVAERFALLGFRLKTGRLHPNGLLNRHLKFRDQTEIELMTVVAPPKDRMARDYSALIAAGDGGAYAAFRVRSLDSVEAFARRLGLTPRRSEAGGWQFLGFEPRSPLAAVFFLAGGVAPIDPDSIVNHPNGAAGLDEARIEGGPELAGLLESLGAVKCPATDSIDGGAEARLALGAGSAVIVPPSDPRGPRRVIGAVLRIAEARGTAEPAVMVLPKFSLSFRSLRIEEPESSPAALLPIS